VLFKIRSPKLHTTLKIREEICGAQLTGNIYCMEVPATAALLRIKEGKIFLDL